MASSRRRGACRGGLVWALLILVMHLAVVHSQEEFSISSPEEIDEYIRMAVKDSRKESSTQNALEPGSEMFKNAEENAKRRLVYSEKPSQYQKKQRLFGNMHSNLKLLSGQAEEETEKKEGDDQVDNNLLAVFQLTSDKIEAFIAERNNSQEGMEGEQMLMLRNQATALLGVAKLGEEIQVGAISQAGALSEEEAEPLSSVNIIKVPWLAALQYAETNFSSSAQNEVNATAFEEWYYGKKMGGQSMYITRSIQEGQASPLGVLTAEEDVSEGEVLLQMPLKCIINQLSIRNRRIKSGFLGEKLKKAFQHNQEWGLAIALLHERNQHRYGDGSKWGEWIDTLRLRLLGTETIQELKGTYAAEMLKIEDEEVESGYMWSSKNVCKSDSAGVCSRRGGSRLNSGVFTREDFRWALHVVKQNAVPVKLATTGKVYLSLVPMANLAEHHPDAGGEIILGLDNIAKFHVGEDVSAFHPIRMTKGPFTDAESFSRYHIVSENVNKYNHVRMKIPGGGAADEDLIYKVQTLRDWRKVVGLPPRSADLARSASQLSLYGEDEEEQKYMDRQNRLISGTNLEPITREEELMLTGRAKSNEEAALIVKPASGSELVEESYSQLYSAPDLEDDISLQMAAKSLKEAAHQFHIAVALNQTEEGSIGKVMNETRNFFKYGTAPAKGLDAIDQLLIQKIDLMSKCGQPHQFVIRASNISEELLCAMRVTFSNETEMNLLESNFNESKAITYTNEMLMLESIEGSISDLLAMHETSIEDDEEELEAEDLSTKKKHAITLRLREKQLLHSTLSFLRDQMEILDEEDHEAYQIAALLQEELEKQRKLDDLKRKLAEEEERLNKKLEVASVEVKVKKFIEEDHYHTESVKLTIFEGDSLTDKVSQFAIKYELDQGARNQLENHLKNSVPNERPLTAMVQTITRHGAVAVLGLREGDNVTDQVERFLLMQGVLEESEDKFKELQESLEGKLNSRLSARSLVQIPVVAPDGRKLTVQVRDGEQHDMVGFMRNFAQYAKLPQESIHPLAQEALKRLPPAILQVPINLGGSRQISMRISSGDDDKLDEVIGHFCSRHDIQDEQAQHQIKRLVLSKLNPGASLL